MDYYQSMRNDYIHKAMYPDDPMRVDWIPKGPAQGTLTIKPKERCPPKFVSKIEGNAVEESARVFFEGIVDAKPQPKFAWYFEDEPIIPGQKGWEEAEIHESRKMSTLILKYTREHHMGKYTLVATNQLGAAECNCDLIVRKKQFPPVFWQRLYNVNGDDMSRFVGEVEVGGWPVPEVYWYRVLEDGEEEEVTSRTHTENWNGNPNKYVPERRIEVRQLDQIRHQIIFHQASESDSGLYRVRAINALGEAECEAELYFDGCGGEGSGNDLYLPPLWRERKRLTWRDEDDQRRKPFVGFEEPELTEEDMAEMRKKCAGVPLGRAMEYLASLPDYYPSDKFRNMDRMPFRPGVDERDYRPDRKGGKCHFPSVFQKGQINHRGYNLDASGRILPVWVNPGDKQARDMSQLNWRPVHPDLWVPDFPERCKSPPAPPVWETAEDLQLLIKLLNSMGCRVPNVTEIKTDKKSQQQKQDSMLTSSRQQSQAGQAAPKQQSFVGSQSVETHSESKQQVSAKFGSKVEKFSYIRSNEKNESSTRKNVETEHLRKAKEAKAQWEEKLNANQAGAQANAASFTAQFMASHNIYEKQDNMSYPELESMGSESRPALPPKTKIMNSPSRNIFSPTDSIESNGTGTASVKTVEFIPVKEKIKLIAAQQEELNRREENQATDNKKHKGVRILPPSPVTVRKMSVEDELYQYDEVVKRTTPITQVLESPRPDAMENTQGSEMFSSRQMSQQQQFQQSHASSEMSQTQRSFSTAEKSEMSTSYQAVSSSMTSASMKSREEFSSSVQKSDSSREQLNQQAIAVPGWSAGDNKNELQERLDKEAKNKQLDSALDQLIAETESMVANKNYFSTETVASQQRFNSYSESSVRKSESQQQMTSSSMQLMTSNQHQQAVEESPAEECRRSFEQAELEAMALASETSKSFSKQSSMVETASVQSFVLQSSDQQQQALNSKTALIQAHFGTNKSQTAEASSASSEAVNRMSATSTTSVASKLGGGGVSSSTAYTKLPNTFVKPADEPTAAAVAQQSKSMPNTPMSQRRRLRINQSPKPPEAENTASNGRPKYREGPNTPFQPGFYRPPPEDPDKSHVFQLVRRSSSRGRVSEGGRGSSQESGSQLQQQSQQQLVQGPVRSSQASSRAYEGDESDLERN